MRFYVVSLLAVALLFAPISARRMRRQAEPETTTESGSETSTDLNNSGIEASGEESGVETSGAETSGAEGSGLESSGIDNNSGTEAASGEESGVETSGAETSGAEGSGLESSGVEASGNEASGEINDGTTSSGTEDEASGEPSGEESTEGPIPVLTLTTLQASALNIQTQADAIVLQTQTINDQMNTLTQDVQKLGDTAKQLNSQVSNAIIQAGSAPTTTTSQTPTESNATCSLDMACFAESECNGGTCLGAFVGTCNCNACFQFKACTDDSQCGGFKTACSNITRTCDCFQAYTNNGLSFFDAQTSMCNKQNCTTDNTDACFGLPCNAGRCVC
ncbi:hypothetical protein WR25_22747 [Diploscapter pachys]|uniref:Chondroitin proteoglycan 3 n=1 Tax=Diploscapter pachys TaxID=2018661 RepID=A0A2A2KUY1_9BILA|nr:hypothetical protein WR25_22747 [Diploscapter pachys]